MPMSSMTKNRTFCNFVKYCISFSGSPQFSLKLSKIVSSAAKWTLYSLLIAILKMATAKCVLPVPTAPCNVTPMPRSNIFCRSLAYSFNTTIAVSWVGFFGMYVSMVALINLFGIPVLAIAFSFCAWRYAAPLHCSHGSPVYEIKPRPKQITQLCDVLGTRTIPLE